MAEKLTIFDFDDTLITSEANIKVIHSSGQEEILSSEEYAKYVPKPGDDFDYSEFDEYPKNAALISDTFKRFKAALQGSGDVTVLTARSNTKPVEKFVADVNEEYIPSVNEGIDSFLNTTFSVIESQEPHKIASAFTFGREDLIPDMFTAIVDEYNTENNLDKFVYYLERHIELDGGDHGPLALELICSLCGDDEKKWGEVEETAIACLQARKKLWDLILDNLN